MPYSKEMIDNALSDLVTQGMAEDQNTAAFLKRYPKAQVRDLAAVQGRLTELDAVIAYLQQLGTQVDFKIYDDKANIR